MNKKGKGTQGEIWCGALCRMQDSHHYPLNISLSSLCSLSAAGENKGTAATEWLQLPRLAENRENKLSAI